MRLWVHLSLAFVDCFVCVFVSILLLRACVFLFFVLTGLVVLFVGCLAKEKASQWTVCWLFLP